MVSRAKAENSNTVKSLIGRLHSILRDEDSNSLIMSRFEEITKLLITFQNCMSSASEMLIPIQGESPQEFSMRVKNNYAKLAYEWKKLIPSQFATIQTSDLAIYRISMLVNEYSSLFGKQDILGTAFEEMIEGSFDKSDNQQFFTPSQVAKFMVQLGKVQEDFLIADPACGTGGFLRHYAAENSGNKILGLEIDERLAWIARMNLMLHGHKKYSIEIDTEKGAFSEKFRQLWGTVDLVITNPPFGSDTTNESILKNLRLGHGHRSRRRGILFLEQSWRLLKEKGQLVIVVDDSILNAEQTRDVREFLLENFDFKAIISLPEETFMPYATVKTSILVLEKSNQGISNAQTFFARARSVGRKANGEVDLIFKPGGEIQENSDLQLILELYRNPDLLHADFNLDCYMIELQKHLDSGLRFDFPYHHPKRYKTAELLKKSKSGLVSLSDICFEVNDRYVPIEHIAEEDFFYTGLSNIEPYTGLAVQIPTPIRAVRSSVKRFEVGDILFSKMRPELRKVTFADFAQGGYVSPECSVLRVRRDANNHFVVPPRFLAALLRSEFVFAQLMHLVTGIGRPRVSSKDLFSIKLPKVSEEDWKRYEIEYASKYLQLSSDESALQELLIKVDESKRDLAQEIIWKMGNFKKSVKDV